ncbi:MAG: response regulator transcription factor [Candidatus Manganitrophus sp.]|nr:response regulator transcription factor [Candidatus Manganitrophus sp.]
MSKIRILIADDHRVVREGLAAILKSRSDMDVVGEAINGFEVIEKTKALKPDVILMDISMPQMNGVEATRAVRKISPEIGIVVLTMHDDDATIFELVPDRGSRLSSEGFRLFRDHQGDPIDLQRRVDDPSLRLPGRFSANFLNSKPSRSRKRRAKCTI